MVAVYLNHAVFYFSEVERRPDPAVASNMKDLGTRSIFSEEHDIYRRSVRHFMETEVVPRHSE